jgi:diguanylate cyclase (GGDEF)-like protein
MQDRRAEIRRRTLKEGKILFNRRRSAIDCVLRNFSPAGACLETVSPVGVPDQFELLIDGEAQPRTCVSIWRHDNKIGVAFRDEASASVALDERQARAEPSGTASRGESGGGLVRGELLALRAALDEIETGVVLLDSTLRAQFINRAFRKMWRLPDSTAEARPSYAALMRHGAETGQYDIVADALDTYVAERIEQITVGDPRPRDLRLSNGAIVRCQCAALPDGGRMLSYAYVTDIAKQADELIALRAALDNIETGVILLDQDFKAQFINLAARQLGRIPDGVAERRQPFCDLLIETRKNGAFATDGPELEALVALRMAQVRAGSPEPIDLRAADGRIVRTQCAVLANGGRMVTYSYVTDLAHHVDELEALARIDPVTGLANRRYFLERAAIEWKRYSRYQDPLSLMMIDVDHFKSINDAFGRQTGDHVLAEIAHILHSVSRPIDAIGRIGGEEFAALLPETTLAQAKLMAERLRRAVEQKDIAVNGEAIRATISIGVAESSDAAIDFAALMHRADQALYLAKSAGRNCVVASRPAPAVAES